MEKRKRRKGRRKRQELRWTSGTERASSAAPSLPSEKNPDTILEAKLCKENRRGMPGDPAGLW